MIYRISVGPWRATLDYERTPQGGSNDATDGHNGRIEKNKEDYQTKAKGSWTDKYPPSDDFDEDGIWAEHHRAG